MGKILKKVVLIGIIFVAVVLSTACGEKLTKEEKAKLEILAVEAKKYYEEKYDESISIGEYDYVADDGMFGFTYNTDLAYFYTSDGNLISWRANKGFADNAQVEAITEAVEALAVESYSGEGYTTYFKGEIKLDNDDFVAYYDGDILKYLSEEEEVGFYTSGDADIIHVSGDVDALMEDINKYFSGHNIFEINVVEESYLGQIVNYGEDGCIAQYDVLGSILSIYKQHYIEIADGIYATAMQDGVVLEDGDLELVEKSVSKEAMLERIQTIYDEATEEHEKEGGFFPYKKQITDMNMDGDFLQLKMSDRLKKQIEAKESGNTWIDVVIKLDEDVLNKGGLSRIEFDWELSNGTATHNTYKSWFKIEQDSVYYFVGDLVIKEID